MQPKNITQEILLHLCTFNYNESEIKMASLFEVNGIMVCGREK